jgi:hypothetical protein
MGHELMAEIHRQQQLFPGQAQAGWNFLLRPSQPYQQAQLEVCWLRQRSGTFFHTLSHLGKQRCVETLTRNTHWQARTFIQAIGIQPDSNTIAVTTKTSKQNQPAKLYHTSSYSASTPSRKLYKSIVNSTAKKGYRSDLRAEAVSRASAIRASQRENKKERNSKPRGAKYRKQQQAEFLKLTPEN